MSISTPRFGCSNSNVYLYVKYNITGLLFCKFLLSHETMDTREINQSETFLYYLHICRSSAPFTFLKSQTLGRRSKIPFELHADKNLCRKRPASFPPRLSTEGRLDSPGCWLYLSPGIFRCCRNATLHWMSRSCYQLVKILFFFFYFAHTNNKYITFTIHQR